MADTPTKPGPTVPDDLADPAAPRRPAARYGDRPPLPRPVVGVAVGLLASVFVGWVVWVGLGAADRDVRWKDVGFRVVDDTAVEVTFDVTKDPDDSARCTLVALSSSFATVGITTVDVGPAARETVRSSATVRTQERAVTGVVDECEPF